jgi:general stress protein CsbA
MKEEEIQDELVSIRNLMERSSKFISLSGLSGILAGVYALIGAGLAYLEVYRGPVAIYKSLRANSYPGALFYLIFIALAVLVLSLVSGYILTKRKADKNGQPVWGKASRSLLFHMATPLTTGGIIILIFIYRGYYGIVGPSSLIFYGLSLVSASSYTFTLVKYLGLCEIVLGLIAACLPGYGLLFWAIGFGILHIVYGSMMYFKYDR